MAQSKEKLKDILTNQEAQEVAVDLIVSENRIPKFLAKKLFIAAIKKLSIEDRLKGGVS